MAYEKSEMYDRKAGNNSDGGITLDEYYGWWIEEKRCTIKANSVKMYRYIYEKNIQPIMGAREIADIGRREIKCLRMRIADEKSVYIANQSLRILEYILREALRDRLISEDPSEGLKYMKMSKARASDTIHRALTCEEQRLFMSELQGEYLYHFLAFLLSTGMRTGEAAVLTEADIDYEKKRISVNKTLSRDENGQYIISLSPKTGSSVREVPLTAGIERLLCEYMGTKRYERLKNGIYTGEILFRTVNGKLINSSTVDKTVRRVLRRLGNRGIIIPHFSAHALRATFATRFIEQGGTAQTLKAILGHSSISITMDLYSHVLQDTKYAEMSRINIVI